MNDYTDLDEIAATILFLEDQLLCAAMLQEDSSVDKVAIRDYDSWGAANKMFKDSIAWFTKEGPWKDGKHCGDCTNDPIACVTCFVEEYRSKARIAIREKLFKAEMPGSEVE